MRYFNPFLKIGSGRLKKKPSPSSTKKLSSIRFLPEKHSPPKNKIISVALDWTRPKDPPLSLGQASILAALKHHNIPHTAKAWSVNQPTFSIAEVQQFIMKNASEKTDLALGAYVWHEPQTQTLLKNLKRDGFPGHIILGGPQISYVKCDLEKFYPEADIFIRGYAENALVKYCLSPEDKPVIPGVHYAGTIDFGLSATADLENLPSPYLTNILKRQPFMRWETQRGCPFQCAFCQHRESDINMVRRQFNHSRLMQEVQWMMHGAVVRDIAVLDPIFNSGPHYLSILQAFIDGQYCGKLALQCRAEMIKPEFLDAIEQLNKTGHVVLEFGLQTIHKDEQKIIQRPNNMKKITHVLEETKKRNIATEVSLIFGLPNQTVESFRASIQYCKELNVPTIYAYPLMLLRGTPLYDQKEFYALKESTDINLQINRIQQNIPHVISGTTFTYQDWLTMSSMAEELDEYNRTQAKNFSRTSEAKMSYTLRHTLWQFQQDLGKNPAYSSSDLPTPQQ